MSGSSIVPEAESASLLPTGLGGLSADQRSRLAERQQLEQSAQGNAVRNLLRNIHAYSHILWFFALQTICTVICSVLLYMKFGNHVHMSWIALLSPISFDQLLSGVLN
jgi:hypothetical protein